MSIALNSVFVSGFESRSLQYEMDPTIPPTITKPFQTQSGQRTHHKDQSISLSFIYVQNLSFTKIYFSLFSVKNFEHFLILAIEKSQIRKGMKKQ